jgi:hypothetical protein
MLATAPARHCPRIFKSPAECVRGNNIISLLWKEDVRGDVCAVLVAQRKGLEYIDNW